MIIADTSIWVDHLRRGNGELAERLQAGEVACHPFIIGELACGRLENRREILSLLRDLPQAPLAEQEEILAFIELNRLAGCGLGFVDVHLMASACMAGLPLWSADRALDSAATRLGIGARERE